VINGTTSFSGKVTSDEVHSEDDVLNARIELIEDNLDDIGAQVTEHIVSFKVKIRYVSGVTEADFNALLGYVGEIVDAIEDNRTLSSTYITRTEVVNASYSTQDRTEGIVIRHCHLSIFVEGHRN